MITRGERVMQSGEDRCPSTATPSIRPAMATRCAVVWVYLKAIPISG